MKVFISHSSVDKKFVRTLKEDLEENGIKTWLDEDELELGDSLVERLDKAIQESTHFIIILSANSVDSEWVKMELTKATLLKNKAFLKKIIPIKYKGCEIPKDLNGLLYGDLSGEIVRIDDNKVKFVSTGYQNLLNKLVKTIRSSDKVLTEEAKKSLKIEIKKIEKTENENIIEVNKSKIVTPLKIKLLLKTIGFKDMEAVNSWSESVKCRTTINSVKRKTINQIFPILFPLTIKLIDPSLTIGDEIIVRYKNLYEFKAHFAGYRTKMVTDSIAIPVAVRKNIHIERNKIYLYEYNIPTKILNILDIERC